MKSNIKNADRAETARRNLIIAGGGSEDWIEEEEDPSEDTSGAKVSLFRPFAIVYLNGLIQVINLNAVQISPTDRRVWRGWTFTDAYQATRRLKKLIYDTAQAELRATPDDDWFYVPIFVTCYGASYYALGVPAYGVDTSISVKQSEVPVALLNGDRAVAMVNLRASDPSRLEFYNWMRTGTYIRQEDQEA